MSTHDALAIDGGTPVRTEPLDFSKGAALLGAEEADALAAVIAERSLFRYKGGLAAGAVAEFERAACALLGCRYAVAVANGTAALRCALAALGVGCGDEVIVPAFTFVATVNAVVAAGAVPVFAEIDDTLGLDPGDLEAQITDRTAAIVAVHLENVPCDLDAVCAVAERRGVALIEDAAQSFGATYHGRAVGTFGALGTFSLQQEKNITAGEGGLVVTDDETRYLRAARFQDQGGQFVTSYASARGDELTEPFTGENLRMGEFAGAVAGVQLARLGGILASLRANKARIVEAVGGIDGLTRRRRPDPDGDGSSSVTWFLPDATLAKRFAAALRAEGIPCAQMYNGRPVYLNAAVLARRTASGKGGPWACAEHPTDRSYGPGLCPRTEALVARSVIVPIGVAYRARDCADVARAVRKVACGLLR
ncbi:MAG: aminotransferase class I/II-fold pyridoxal phosphate-dependent enzyme [Actinomycetota bacterium]|nr:aminotransferase class I/II-fold pyridoxal phosphate-dependent enzyme [Actinomycetota bacterium]